MSVIKKYLSMLKCPKDGSNLTLVDGALENENIIISGQLISEKDKNSYSIENNIIKFVDNNNYAKSFEKTHKNFPKILFDQNAEGMKNHTKTMFNKIINDYNFQSKIVCDIGSGGGRFINEAFKQNPKLIIALDYSGAIEQLNKNLLRKDILLIQADALNNPIKDNQIDFCYSIGVLHHTKNTEKGFAEMVRIIKKGGYVALSVYRKGYYCNLCVTIMRNFLNLFNEDLKYKIAYIYAKLVYSIIPAKIKPLSVLRKFIPYVYLPNKEWSIYDTVDSITPKYQRCFTMGQVRKIFENNDLINIKATGWGVSHIGKKKY